jgi:sodium/proline symporter
MAFSTIAALICYAATLIAISYIAHRKHASSSDFAIGGRAINFWVTALTAHASDMSSWLFMGLPMAVYIGGLSQASIAFGLVSGMFLNWQFLAPRLRTETERYGANTLSSFLSVRFGDQAGFLRVGSAAVILIFMTHYLAAGLIGLGFLFESVFGIDYHTGIAGAATVVVLLTTIGGFVAVAWADAFQGLFLLLMILIVPFCAWLEIDPAALSRPIGQSSGLSGLSQVFLALAWGIGYFGSPHIVTKFMGIRDAKELWKSKWVGTCWQITTLSASVAVGWAGSHLYINGLENPELVFVQMVQDLFPPFLGGFVLCGILAATVSTMDSQLLVVSGVMSEDIYRPWFNPTASPERLVLVARAALVTAAALALYLAWDQNKTVLSTVFYSWTGLGASFGPLLLLALYDQKTNLAGALSGLVVGAGSAILIPDLALANGEVSIPTMIPAFMLSTVSIWTVSRLPMTAAFK